MNRELDNQGRLQIPKKLLELTNLQELTGSKLLICKSTEGYFLREFLEENLQGLIIVGLGRMDKKGRIFLKNIFPPGTHFEISVYNGDIYFTPKILK